jgi:hypothetical protein
MERLSLGLSFITAIELPKLKTGKVFCHLPKAFKSVSSNLRKVNGVYGVGRKKLQGGEVK